MRHLLSPKHHEHLHKVGIENAHDLFIVDVNHEHYQRQKESWKRTLPLASEEELHMHALASVLWKTQERGKPKPKVKKYRYHWFLLGIIILLIALLYFIWPRNAHAQIIEVQGAGKGSTTSNVATVTPVDANHNAIDVNITAGGGTGGGPADAAANAAASESDIARQKVIAVIRLLDTGQGAGSQLVTAKGDQTSGMWVNCKSGCAGGSSTPADTFATPTTAGLTLAFTELWNGATFDRWYGDKTNGAFVNVKTSVLPTGAALDASLTTLDTDVKANVTLHAGTAVIGHVIADSGSTTVVTGNVAVTSADGADVTLGAKADAKSTATDVTPVTLMQVLKEISAMEQAPASRAVTNAGTFATQSTLSAETTKVIGTVNVAAGQTIAVTNTTASNLNAQVVGAGADGSATSGNPVLVAGKGSGNARVPVVCDNWKPFSLAATTALKLVTLASSKQTYICSINIVSAGANNIALIEGTKVTTECDTATAGMAGGTTAATGWNFAANGGLTQGTGIGVVAATATVSHDVCLLASASTQVSGVISWTQF